MGLRVTAEQAGWLTRHSERMVRWHIQTRQDLPATKAGRSWRIDVDALAALPGWRVDPARLAELEATEARTAASMAARLAELERQMRDVRARLARLEASSPQTTRSDGQQTASDGAGAMVSYPDGIEASGGPYSAPGGYRGPRTVTLADRGPGAPLRFRTKTDAARWLSRHGVNELTPKSWRGWPPAELTPAGVLSFALEVQRDARARGDWRVSWELRRCTDDACVCRELLEG